MSSNANSAASGSKQKRSPQSENEIPPDGDRRDDQQPTASSLLGLPTPPPQSAESNLPSTTTTTIARPETQSSPVVSAVGEGGSGLGGSTNRGIYARPTPPRRSTPRTYISEEGSPAPKPARGGPQLKTRIPSGRKYFPRPDMDLTEEDMKREDGTEYSTKAEALFEKSWKKYDPNRLGTILGKDLAKFLTQLESDGGLAQSSVLRPKYIAGINEKCQANPRLTIDRHTVHDWFREASGGRDLDAILEDAIGDAPFHPMSPIEDLGFTSFANVGSSPYDPYDDLDHPTGPFNSTSTPAHERSQSPAAGYGGLNPRSPLSPRMAALQINTTRTYTEAQYDKLLKSRDALEAQLDDLRATYENKVHSRESQLTALEADLVIKDRQIMELQNHIDEVKLECTKYREISEGNNAHIGHLEIEMTELQKMVEDTMAITKDAQDKQSKAEEETKRVKELNRKLTKDVAERDATIKDKEAMYKRAYNDAYTKAYDEAKAELTAGDSETTDRIREAEKRADDKDEQNHWLKKESQYLKSQVSDLQKQLSNLSSQSAVKDAEIQSLKETANSKTPEASYVEDESIYGPPRSPSWKSQPYPYQRQGIDKIARITENVKMSYAGKGVQTDLSIPADDFELADQIVEFAEDPILGSVECLRKSGELEEEEIELMTGDLLQQRGGKKPATRDTGVETAAKETTEQGVETERPKTASKSTSVEETAPTTPTPDRAESPSFANPFSNLASAAGTLFTHLTPSKTPTTATNTTETPHSASSTTTIIHRSPSTSNPNLYSETILTPPSTLPSLLHLLASQHPVPTAAAIEVLAFVASQSREQQRLLAVTFFLASRTAGAIRKAVMSGTADAERLRGKIMDAPNSGEGPREGGDWAWAARGLLENAEPVPTPTPAAAAENGHTRNGSTASTTNGQGVRTSHDPKPEVLFSPMDTLRTTAHRVKSGKWDLYTLAMLLSLAGWTVVFGLMCHNLAMWWGMRKEGAVFVENGWGGWGEGLIGGVEEGMGKGVEGWRWREVARMWWEEGKGALEG